MFRLDSIESAQREEAQAVQSLAKAGHVTTHREPITPHDMFTALQVISLLYTCKSR